MGRNEKPAFRRSDGSGSALKILLIGINYEPEVAGIGPFTTGLARHLAAAGHQIEVVAGVPHYPAWKRDRAYGDGSSNPVVRRCNHFVPRRPGAVGRLVYEATWMASALPAVLIAQADIIIGVVPSLSGAALAYVASKRRRKPFGILVQDVMGSAAAQSGYSGGRWVAGFVGTTELFIARRANVVGIVAEGFRQYLVHGGVEDTKIVRVRNWGSDGRATLNSRTIRQRFALGQSTFICLHAGNMGQKQALDNLIYAAQHLSPDTLIVLTGDGNDKTRLIEKAKRMHVGNVRFLPPQPAGIYESMLRAADVLLLNQRRSVSDMALPSKLATYFAAGKPVVAAVSEESEAGHEVRMAGGIVVLPEKPDKLAAAINEVKASRELMAEVGRRARDYFERNLTEEAALQGLETLLVNTAAMNRDIDLARARQA